MLAMVLVLARVPRAVARGGEAEHRAADPGRAGHRRAALHAVLGVLPRRCRRGHAALAGVAPERGEERRTALRIVLAIAVGWPAVRAVAARRSPTRCSTPARRGTRRRARPRTRRSAIIDFAGGRMIEGWTLVLPLVLLALLALRRPRPGPVEHRRRPAHGRRACAGSGWSGSLTLFGGLTLSFFAGSGFQSRYAAVMYPLFALAVAFGIIVLGDQRMRYGRARRSWWWSASSAACATSSPTARRPPGHRPDHARRAARRRRRVLPGPARSRRLAAAAGRPRRSKQYTFPNFESPKFVDWVDYADRNRRGIARRRSPSGLLERAGDHRIWFVWSTGYRTFDNKCEQMLNAPRCRPRAGRDAGASRRRRSTSSWASPGTIGERGPAP